jgi:chromosome segregation ATPase
MKLLVALGLLSSAMASEVTPVEKVITLLNEMQNKIVEEGKAEAATYDTFACFCKDTSEAKTKSINDLDTQIEGLNADLAEETKNRNEADAEMRKQEEEIAKLAEDAVTVTAGTNLCN